MKYLWEKELRSELGKQMEVIRREVSKAAQKDRNN